MVNQAFRIKIAYRSKEEKKKKKIPGIGQYPMGPTNTQVSATVAALSYMFLLSYFLLIQCTVVR